MMKTDKLLILNILLFIFALTCNAEMYSTSSYIQQRPGCNMYQTRTVSMQPTLGYSNGGRIGYSTHRGSAFGETSYYRGTYTPSTSYSSTSYGGSGSGRPGGGPRKVSGLGWITWLGWGMYYGVPSSASNEDMNAYHNAWKENNNLTWEDWYASVYGSGSDPEGPPSPGDPYATPIGDAIPFMITLGIVYCYIKRKTASV